MKHSRSNFVFEICNNFIFGMSSTNLVNTDKKLAVFTETTHLFTHTIEKVDMKLKDGSHVRKPSVRDLANL